MPLGRQIWPSGVLLHSPLGKWGMQNAVQTRWPYVNFARFPHFNYNVKPKLAGKFLLLVFEFETFCGGSKNIISHFWSKPNWQIKKKKHLCDKYSIYKYNLTECVLSPPSTRKQLLSSWKAQILIFAQDAVHCAVELRFQIQYRIQRMKGSFYVLLSHIFPKEGY